MLPVLFHIGPYPIGTHDCLVLLGVVAATLVYLYEAERRAMLNDQLLSIAIGALFCGAVAAKLSTAWRYLAFAPEPSLLGMMEQGGKSILGGLAGAYAGAVLTKRLIGYREPTGDLFAPAVALGMAIGRWGCFLTEQIGTPTELPWGISVSKQAAAHIPSCPYCGSGVKLHPSFIYEIIFHALMFGCLWWLRPRVSIKGDLLKIYLLAYALFRFAVEFVRGNQVVWEGLTRSQLFLIPSTLLLLLYFWRRWARGAHTPTTLQGGT
ncbi:MAG TPA: prolipoprotein diacylglyceryl transferase family protein [Herpetosiphonaceae bacterium]|nr:prolipoprotein diacylglyceryl transferase family protein [Herpetosiphonaceae bacterium]